MPSSKGSCVVRLLSSWELLGNVEQFTRQTLVRHLRSLKGVSSKGIVGPWSLLIHSLHILLLFPSLFSSCSYSSFPYFCIEVNISSITHFNNNVPPKHVPKRSRINQLRHNASIMCSQSKTLFLINFLSQFFITVMGNWLTQTIWDGRNWCQSNGHSNKQVDAEHLLGCLLLKKKMIISCIKHGEN